MLRELLRENLESLLLTINKIAYAFEFLEGTEVFREDLQEIKRLVHSLKGNLMLLGLKDDAQNAIKLEEVIFSYLEAVQTEEITLSKTTINEWFKLLNEIEFSLKAYMF
jgi:chemotaxis protein histidine kinase CheA